MDWNWTIMLHDSCIKLDGHELNWTVKRSTILNSNSFVLGLWSTLGILDRALLESKVWTWVNRSHSFTCILVYFSSEFILFVMYEHHFHWTARRQRKYLLFDLFPGRTKMLRIHWFSMTLRITDLLTVRQHWNYIDVKKRKWIDTVDSSIHPRSYINFNLIITCRSLKIDYRPMNRTNLKILTSANIIYKYGAISYYIAYCIKII